MNYSFGDVISVKFPQSGRQDTKRRPAVVVLDIGDADVVVVPVTSVPRSLAGDHAYMRLRSAIAPSENEELLRAFKRIATLVAIDGVVRPPDRMTDFAGGALTAKELGMRRLAERLAEAR